jgi:hypothetical protein
MWLSTEVRQRIPTRSALRSQLTCASGIHLTPPQNQVAEPEVAKHGIE